MKLSDITAKLTGIRSFAVRTPSFAICTSSFAVRALATLVLAGEVLTAAAPAAPAQQVAFGVQFGGPRYGESVPVARGYYGYGYAPGYFAPRHDWEQREAWERRQAWERYHHGFRGDEPFGRRGYGYRSY